MALILEGIDNLIEEVKWILDNSGPVPKRRKVTDRQVNAKVTGKTWNGTRYVNHTGSEKRRYKLAAKKRAKTMKIGHGDRARRMKIKKKLSDRIRRTKRVDN
jgi:hypothetical protein